jgi:alpha-mannosidase
MRTLFAALALAAVPTLPAAQPREWKIYVITHTHADIGYTELIPEVERGWRQGIDQAVAAAAKGLKWTLEGSLLFDDYQRHRSPEKVRPLVRLIREGKIEVASLYTNIEQENTGPEELVRSTFFAGNRLKREFGIECKTAMLSDITGLTWGLPRALAGSGTRYLVFGPGTYKELFGQSTLPHLFYYASQDGSKVLTQLRTGKYRHYSAAGIFLNPDAMEKGIPDLLKYYEEMGDRYPYDALMLQVAFDNKNPQIAIADNIRLWNSKHRTPSVHMATPAEFFEYVEKKYGPKIPVLSGDLTSAWTDDPGIYAQATGMKRRAANEVLSAEIFSALDQMIGTDRPYPKDAIEQIYKDLLIYSDHTYGLSSWGWEHGPLTASLGRLFSPVWDPYKESWENKKEYAYRAASVAGELLGDALESLASKIPADDRSLVVFNPLSWPRTDVVRLLSRGVKAGARGYDLIDAVTGEKTPYQALGEGGDPRYDTIVFVAKDVPALGYKVYRMAASSSRKSAESARGPAHAIENEFYRVEVDPATGAVSSIFDRQLRRELVDRRGTDKVNQYLYYSVTGAHEEIYHDRQSATHQGRVWTKDLKISAYTPLSARITLIENGPAIKTLRAESVMDHTPAPATLIQDVTLYPGVKRIDFVNRLHKSETLAKEEVYFAFPFDVPGFEINCELPGAVFRPGKDQLSGSFTGFSGIQHWADASNRDFGVTVATREVPAIEFGEIRTNEWSMAYTPSRSAFYFYVMNNKENTNGAQWQGSESWRLGFLELHFSVTSHAGGWRDGNATQFGWAHNAPLASRFVGGAQTGTLPPAKASFSEGLPRNVILQSLKQAEDGKGYVARFYETEGRAADVAWSGLPGRIAQARLSNLVETPGEAVKVDGIRVRFTIGPWQLLTLRLYR